MFALLKQVRTPPVRPADGVVECVYESFVPGEDYRGLGLRADLVEATQCFRVREIRYAINRLFKKSRKILISACRKHVVAATRPSPFKVGDNQRPERTMSGVRKPPPESSVPGETLTGGRRRNQFCRGYGSPSVLNEVSHEFSTAMRFEKCKRSP